MTLEKKVARAFNLTSENWLKHTNPWSVWTRCPVLPVIVLAFWSRLWIGWWCLIPGLISILWIFINPVIFKVPRSTKNWVSKAVLGERVYLNRDTIAIPNNHNIALHNILNNISSAGIILSIWAIITYSVWGSVLGIALTYLGKSWYLDRMGWLYEDVKHLPEYGKWLC